jgi:hypothetical protein
VPRPHGQIDTAKIEEQLGRLRFIPGQPGRFDPP